MPFQVAVCGPRHCTEDDQSNAYRVGQLLAQRGVTVLCGGGTGVMAAVAAGVRSNNGVVIGIGGSWGTLSEIALANRRGGIPVISLGGWRVLDHENNEIEGIEHVRTAEDAVARAYPVHESPGDGHQT